MEQMRPHPDPLPSGEREKAVEVENITKRFGDLVAVDDVSFTVDEGEFFGFLGPNGAGKTTLIRILTTLIKPTGGRARVACCDVARNPEAVRREIGVVTQAMTSDLDLTGYENMDIYGRFYGITKREREERIAYLLDMVGLISRKDDLVATYSGGMRRRLEVARVLIHRPKILFLDEPTIGLDPQSRRVVWEFIRGFRKDSMTVFLTTHYMDEAEGLCDRVAIIDRGKIIAMGTPGELKAAIPGNDIVSLSVESVSDPLIEGIMTLPFVHKIGVEGVNIMVYVDNGAQNLPYLLGKVASTGVRVISATIHQQSLEDVFIHHTGRAVREEEAKKVSFLIGAGAPQKWGR